MDNIKDIVKKVVGDIALKRPVAQEQIESIWENVLEARALNHTRLSNFKDGMLSVYVDSPAWLYEMNLKKGKILERLKEKVPEVKSISFRIGKIG